MLKVSTESRTAGPGVGQALGAGAVGEAGWVGDVGDVGTPGTVGTDVGSGVRAGAGQNATSPPSVASARRANSPWIQRFIGLLSRSVPGVVGSPVQDRRHAVGLRRRAAC